MVNSAQLERATRHHGFGRCWNDFDWDCEQFLGLLPPIRHAFDEYVSLRPLPSPPGVHGALSDTCVDKVDLVIVGENTQGEYTGVGGRIHRGTGDEIAIENAVFTHRGVERAVRYAFAIAQSWRCMLTSATMSNAVTHCMVLWDETLGGVAAAVSAGAGTQPVCGRAGGGAALQSLAHGRHRGVQSLRRHPQRCRRRNRQHWASAREQARARKFANVDVRASPRISPRVAGTGTANPGSQILSGSMMVHQLGETAEIAAGVIELLDGVAGDPQGQVGHVTE